MAGCASGNTEEAMLKPADEAAESAAREIAGITGLNIGAHRYIVAAELGAPVFSGDAADIFIFQPEPNFIGKVGNVMHGFIAGKTFGLAPGFSRGGSGLKNAVKIKVDYDSGGYVSAVSVLRDGAWVAAAPEN